MEGAEELAKAGGFQTEEAERIAAMATERFDLGSITFFREPDPTPDPWADLKPGDTIRIVDADGNHVATGTVQPRKHHEPICLTIPAEETR
jgi:hypothetical protein